MNLTRIWTNLVLTMNCLFFAFLVFNIWLCFEAVRIRGEERYLRFAGWFFVQAVALFAVIAVIIASRERRLPLSLAYLGAAALAVTSIWELYDSLYGYFSTPGIILATAFCVLTVLNLTILVDLNRRTS